jgi:hypothetical protein
MSPATHDRDFTDEIAVREEQAGYAGISRNEAIKAIRAALKRRTGKTWSVTGGRGSAWGWIRIDAPPKRRTAVRAKTGEKDASTGFDLLALRDTGIPQEFGHMTQEDHDLLCETLGCTDAIGGCLHSQGIQVPASSDYRAEYIARAEGRKPAVYGVQYWD